MKCLWSSLSDLSFKCGVYVSRSVQRSLFGGGSLTRHGRSKQADDSPSSCFEAIDIEEIDNDNSVSSSGPIKGLSGVGSAFRQVKPATGRRHTTDSDGSPASTSSESKKEKHVWRPYWLEHKISELASSPGTCVGCEKKIKICLYLDRS